jgi:hypothetical protein
LALSQAVILLRTCFLSLLTSAASDVKKQSPSLSTRLGFPVKVSVACDAAVAATSVLTTVFFARNARELAESLILVEMLEPRSIVSVVRAARGDMTVRGGVAVLGGSAACDAAVAAASVLTMVFFAQNARELAESLILVEMLELRPIVSVVRAARGDVTMRGGFAACGAAEMFFLAVVACVR